jgi:hypothetical protein
MAVFSIKGTISATDYPGTNPGDIFTLTVTTDGFAGMCTVANGHLISVTGNLDGTPYDITLTNGYPASPSFNPATNRLTGQGQLGAGGPFNVSIFTYDPNGFSLADENNGASGVFSGASPCPKNAQGV